jgi:hypothetical protein
MVRPVNDAKAADTGDFIPAVCFVGDKFSAFLLRVIREALKEADQLRSLLEPSAQDELMSLKAQEDTVGTHHSPFAAITA